MGLSKPEEVEVFRVSLLGMAALALICIRPADAGRNSRGALIVHTDDLQGYTSLVCLRFDATVPQECGQLNTRTDRPWDWCALIWFIAAFDEATNPGVSTISFGNDHNLPAYYHHLWGLCGPSGSIEVPDEGWPDEPGSAGNRVVFSQPIIGDTFFPFYWMDVWGFEGAYYGTGVNPVLGYAAFVDDSDPPQTDAVERFGEVHWYESGHNACPSEPIGDLVACCIENGSCLLGTEALCIDIGGESLGPGSVCDPNPCPQPPRWACCLEDGQCRLKTPLECEEIGGTSQEEGTECDPNPCPPPVVAACCTQNGGCSIETELDCAEVGGAWHEGMLSCDPNPCMGACCFWDGECQMLSDYWCEPMGGDYMGDGTECDPNPCVTEACCFADGTCQMRRPEVCLQLGGLPQGSGSNCDPNPCTTSGVPEDLLHETTWGAIKATYRE